MSDAEYYKKDWMTDAQWECAKFLADVYGGFHHVNGEIKSSGSDGVVLELDHISLATYDFDEMTRIVLMSHDRCIRFGVTGPRMEEREYDGIDYEVPVMTVVVSKRKRDGRMHERHPTLETVMAEYKK